MSDDHKDRFPKLPDGVSPDWRTWKQRVMPGLYGKTSAAYPDKNLYQVLEIGQSAHKQHAVALYMWAFDIPLIYQT